MHNATANDMVKQKITWVPEKIKPGIRAPVKLTYGTQKKTSYEVVHDAALQKVDDE